MGRRHKPHLRCPSCRMHRSVCICALLPRLETRTRVVLVLHQLEAAKPTNTGVIAARCLVNSTVVYRGRAPDETGDGGGGDLDIGALAAAGLQPVLLYPHQDATPIEAFRDAARPLALIVPDGTWPQAARIRTRLARQGDLPCVAVPAGPEVERRLRGQGQGGHLATLEAVALALGVLEGPAVGAALLHVFRVMTERTLWTNGRIAGAKVTGGIPAGVRPHDPLGLARAAVAAPPDPRTPAAGGTRPPSG
jgi:DTW domain-containing protein YfiP